MLLKLLTFLLPWPLRRRALNTWFGYRIHPAARIGWAWVFPGELVMEAGARIDNFNVAIHLDKIEMGEQSSIGRKNWITGFPTNSSSKHFQHQQERKAQLVIGASSAITKNHHLDCTSTITIGRFTTIAGYRSQFLTHSINTSDNRQDSAPITIGDYAFVGTNVVVLGGASLPDYSVLGAKSLLTKPFLNEWMLYGGVPAQPIREVPKNAKYFSRTEGYVY